MQGVTNSSMAICAVRNAGLSASDAPRLPRTKASVTEAGALTMKRKWSGTCDAWRVYFASDSGA